MKTGVIFSGQGAQFPGMGSKYYTKYESARDIFEQAGAFVKDKCFNGSPEDLKETKVTQPTVFTAQMAAWAALCQELALDSDFAGKIEISGVAGFSLGEYGAYTASGVFPNFVTGLDLVTNRGIFMSESGKFDDGSPRGGMAAVIGDRETIIEAVAKAREHDVLEAVNFNSQKQTAVAGDIDAIARLRASAKESGLKVIPLSVSTAFHSSIMDKASDALASHVESMEFFGPEIKMYSNITGRDVMEEFEEGESVSDYIREKIALQVKNPVYWQETIENMGADGIEVFVETGPGKTLSGLVKKILPDAKVYCISDPEGLEELKNIQP